MPDEAKHNSADAPLTVQSVKLHVAPRPCNTCPYRRSTPPGIWAPDEYAKLPAYDRRPGDVTAEGATFHCHQENATGVATVCRGWLGAHPDSFAVRLAVAVGLLDSDDINALPDVDPTLYASGAEACAAGLAGVEQPSASARDAAERLMRKRAGRL